MVTFLSHPFFTEQVLPFLLVFTLVFAILDKTKILGDRRQISAIIAFVIGLLLIAFPAPRNIIVGLMPLLAVLAVILLVFLMLYGFVGGGTGEKWMKITFGILIGLALIIAIFVFTGYWDKIIGAVSGGGGSEIATNVLFIAIIIAAIAVVLSTGKSGGGGSSGT